MHLSKPMSSNVHEATFFRFQTPTESEKSFSWHTNNKKYVYDVTFNQRHTVTAAAQPKREYQEKR